MPGAYGPFEILKRVNDNAYKVNLAREFDVSATFKVADLSPYLEDDHLVNLRSNSSQQGEDGGSPSREHETKLQEQQESLSTSTKGHGMIKSLLSQFSALPGFEQLHKPNFVLLIS